MKFNFRIEEQELEIAEKASGVFQILQPIPIASSSQELPVDEDDAIKKRLNALKADQMQENTDQNIESRLSELKGMPYKDYSKVLFEKDTRTESEQINDLIKQFVGESEIDQQIEKERDVAIDDIERRLAELRGSDYKKTEIPIDPVPETETEEIDRTMKKYLDEVKLEDIALDPAEKKFIDSIPKPPNKQDIEELPFCEICNEDAVMRCIDCDDDLFCASCFKEFHYEEDYKNHRTVSYKAPAPKNQD